MAQKAAKDLCGFSEQLGDDLDADQLAAAKEYIDVLTHPLKPDDSQALLSLLPQGGDTAAGLNWSLLHRRGSISYFELKGLPFHVARPQFANRQGMLYSPAHGDTAFTVPLCDQYMRRTISDLT